MESRQHDLRPVARPSRHRHPENFLTHLAEVTSALPAVVIRLGETGYYFNRFTVMEETIRVQQGRFSATTTRLGDADEARLELQQTRAQVLDDYEAAVDAQGHVHPKSLLDLL